VVLYAPCDYVITQSFTCMAKDEAQKHIKQTAKRLRSTEDDAISQQEDLFVALDMLQAGHIAFGKYHFSLMVSAPGTERLIKDTNSLINAFTDLGITPTLSVSVNFVFVSPDGSASPESFWPARARSGYALPC
ncbi:hypothetical protein ACKFBN_18425, partial [Yersinia enterocolitica]